MMGAAGGVEKQPKGIEDLAEERNKDQHPTAKHTRIPACITTVSQGGLYRRPRTSRSIKENGEEATREAEELWGEG